MHGSGRKSIAIITARGGSKRIFKKNIRQFCGRPIIEYSIEAAIASELFQEIMVSTDDEEIAGIALKNGARVPFRRGADTSGDYATTVDVLFEVLEEYQNTGEYFERACCIYPTAPFITAERLRKAMNLLEDQDIDAVIPVVAFSFPPMRGMYIREGKLKYCYPEYTCKRSQDIEPMYHDCGQFYCFKPDVFLKKRKLITEKTKAIIIPEQEMQDIDTLDDWAIAEIKYKRIKAQIR